MIGFLDDLSACFRTDFVTLSRPIAQSYCVSSLTNLTYHNRFFREPGMRYTCCYQADLAISRKLN